MGETRPVTDDPGRMSRRQALKGLIALVGGTVSAAELAPLAHAAMNGDDGPPRFLDTDQYALLGRVVDLMIPETDTPGAYAAGVHRFIDMMLADFAEDASRTTMLETLTEIEAAAADRHGQRFVDLSPQDQFELLADIDARAYEDAAGAVPYRMLKSSVLLGYYTSEIGASVELYFNPIPGGTPGCVPLETVGRAAYKSL